MGEWTTFNSYNLFTFLGLSCLDSNFIFLGGNQGIEEEYFPPGANEYRWVNGQHLVHLVFSFSYACNIQIQTSYS
jgi:hypothetical protein